MRSANDAARAGNHLAALVELCRVPYDGLLEQTRKVPENGYAFSGGEREHARGVVFRATPIRKQTGQVITALLISRPLLRLTAKALQPGRISVRNPSAISDISAAGRLT
jgi:DNA-binding IclR family transcriptional regulator